MPEEPGNKDEILRPVLTEDSRSASSREPSQAVRQKMASYLAPIWINISLSIDCLVKTRNYSILSLAFIVSSFRVTEENLVFETVQSGTCSSFECFLCSLRN